MYTMAGSVWINDRLRDPSVDVAVEELGIERTAWFRPFSDQGQKHKRFAHMRDYDSGVGGFVSALQTLLAQPKWRVTPGTGPDADRAYAIVSDSLESLNTPLPEVLEDLLSSIVYGWAGPEAVFELEDGRVLLRDLAPRSQDEWCGWVFDERGKFAGWNQRTAGSGVAQIPVWKTAYMECRSAPGKAPGGASLLQASSRPSYFQEKLEEAEATRAEHDAVGLPVYQVPPALLSANATAAQRTERRAKENFIRRIRRGRIEGALVPSKTDPKTGTASGYELGLLASPGGAVPLDAPIHRYQVGVLVPLLAQFLTLGQTTGSYALADNFTSLFALSGGVLLGKQARALTRPIELTCRLNQITDRSSFPRIVHTDIESRNVAVFADAIAKLLPMGLIQKTDQVIAAAHEALGLEPPTQ